MGTGKAERLDAEGEADSGVDVAVDIKIADPGEPGVANHWRLLDAQIDAEAGADVFTA